MCCTFVLWRLVVVVPFVTRACILNAHAGTYVSYHTCVSHVSHAPTQVLALHTVTSAGYDQYSQSYDIILH